MSEDISLEEKLKAKLESGEISKEEHEELHQKFSKLGLFGTQKSKTKPRSKNWSFVGEKFTEGGKVDGPVGTSGKLTVDGDLECQRLSVSGSMTIDGSLTVIGSSMINGTVNVDGITKFGGPVSTIGSIISTNKLYASEGLSVSGRVHVDGDLTSSGVVNVSGKLETDNLNSTETVRVSGDVIIHEDVVCKEFEASKGNSSVGGDLKAERVDISFIAFEGKKADPLFNVNDIPEIGSLVKNVAETIIPSVKSVSGTLGNLLESVGEMFGIDTDGLFKVDGNIEGSNISIANTLVKGDIIGENIVIGDNVEVRGTVRYKQSLDIPEGTAYSTEKLED